MRFFRILSHEILCSVDLVLFVIVTDSHSFMNLVIANYIRISVVFTPSLVSYVMFALLASNTTDARSVIKIRALRFKTQVRFLVV